MSSFASRVQKTIELPNDPPHTVLIQKLQRQVLTDASDRQQEVNAGQVSRMRAQFGEQLVNDLVVASQQKPKADVVVAADPLKSFDVDTLLTHGIKSWSYTDVPITDETLKDLDVEAAEFIAREILRLTAPQLFADYDAQAAQKNGSASSGAA